MRVRDLPEAGIVAAATVAAATNAPLKSMS
jgi:hypothetical protein